MDTLTARIDSETARLMNVIMGLPDTFHRPTPEIINEAQQRYYFTENHPDRD